MTSKAPDGIKVNMQETYITREEVEKIVAEKVKEALEEFVRKGEGRIKELSLIERIVKVEEELKALREIEQARFEASEKRFEALQKEIEARFEASEKRFEALQREIQARFEAFEKRFEALQREMDACFSSLERRLNFTQWIIVVGFTLLGTLITVANFLR